MSTQTSTSAPVDTDWSEALRGLGSRWPAPERRGRVVRALGGIVQVAGLQARIGDACEFVQPGREERLLGEVVGLEGEHVIVVPLGEMSGLSSRTQVIGLGRAAEVGVGDELLGRVLDGHGRSIGNGDRSPCLQSRPLRGSPPDALTRAPVMAPLMTGVRAIDGLLTCGRGQRVGIFAPAGGGKSSLLSMIVRGCECDVVVLALVGERGREVGEFLHEFRQLGLADRSVVIVATSDRPAAERAKAAEVAMTCAEHFRDQGRSVLLLMDSVTRYARALREIGLAAGEPPTRRGYPPSVFDALPRLFERAGCGERGEISAFFTVLIDDDAAGDPVFEEARATLDGHILLSSRLADGGHYPAIDVLASRSRVMQRVAAPGHVASAREVRELMQKLQDIQTLVQIGEYRPGADDVADRALAAQDELTGFLRQATNEISRPTETQARLEALAAMRPS